MEDETPPNYQQQKNKASNLQQEDFPSLPPPNYPKSTRNPKPSKPTPTNKNQNVHFEQKTTDENNINENPKKQNVPPIILKDTSKWLNCSNYLKANNINFSRARQADGGIKIYPIEPKDYKIIIHFLGDQKYAFYTFHLPEEKHLHIVIRGNPINFSPKDVKNELEDTGFHPTAMYRMNMPPNRRPISLVLVLLPGIEIEIFQVNHILGLEIKV